MYAQFSSANLASAVLVSSNPTNLVLSGAFSISYTSYTAFIVLPALFTALFLYPTLVVLFGIHSRRWKASLIPRNIGVTEHFDEEFARRALVDKNGAIIGSALLLITLVVLVATSPLKPTVPVWRVTIPGALLMALRDIWTDRALWKKVNKPLRAEKRSTTTEFEMTSPPTDQSTMDASATPPSVTEEPMEISDE